ncbi:sugar transporter ERD6-like 16 isoform X2 [Jatropha curcas]|nr:sugar transporter ERD6-like 16 isoform X2 [Jatropha curcas]
MKDLNLSTSQYSVFGSILPIGAMFGAFTSGRIADHIGRKGAMRMSAGFCIAGWLAVFFSEQNFSLDMGRFVTGYGIGVFSFVVPVFIAEISPKNLRGGLTALNQLLNITGASTAFLLGSVISWRALALTGLVPCIFLLIGLFFVPESPRWLAKVGRDKEFKVALQKLRGKDADITREADEIKDSVEILQALPKTRVLDLFQRQYISAVFIAGGIMMLQQFSGINGIAYYTRETFVAAGLSSATIGTTAYACVEVPATMVGALLMDKCGRKPLIMFSAVGTFLGCSIAGISFLLKSHGLLLEWVPGLAVAGLLIFISAYAIGMGPVPWGIMSEIFPINMKGVGGSLVVLVNWLGAWIVAYTFNFLISWSFSGTFFLYSAFSLMTFQFVAKFVPETKGKTLEEIQEYIHRNGERISSGKLEILV